MKCKGCQYLNYRQCAAFKPQCGTIPICKMCNEKYDRIIEHEWLENDECAKYCSEGNPFHIHEMVAQT